MSYTNLPARWVSCPTSDVATLVRGVTYGKQDARKSEVKGFRPILRANNINGTINFDDLVFLPSHLISPAQQLRSGDILFAMSSGSRHLVGKSARINRDLDVGFGAFCGVLRPCDEVSDGYLFLVYQTRDFRRAVSEVSKGSNINNLKREHLLDYEIPLPPLAEQRRIVAKIEELFSELDAGEESLRRARRQLGVYRQALLKQAFEGKLTAQWRKQNPHLLEYPEQLFKQIQTERKRQYEQQLNEWKASKGKGIKPAAPKPIGSLSEDEIARHHSIPDGWTWIKLGMAIDDPAYGTSKKCDYECDGLGVLRIPNVVNGSIDAGDLKFAAFSNDERKTYELKEGDLLMIRSNGSVSIVGRCARIDSWHTQFAFAGYLIRLRALASVLESCFLLQQLSSPLLRSQIELSAKSTSGVNNINSKEIQSLVLSVPSLPEQREIVRLLDEQFTVIEQNEREIDAALKRSVALRQSILKKAFTGQLVPQDPTDEHAATLLERIRKERVASTAKPQKKKTARKRVTCQKT